MSVIDTIKQLGLPEKQFVVIGSAILEAKGIRKANDFDIMVPREVFDELKQDPNWVYTQKEGKTGMYEGKKIDILKKDGCEIYHHIYEEHDFSWFMEQGDRVEVIDGICFGSLSTLLFKKELWGRPKDLEDVRLIKEYMREHGLERAHFEPTVGYIKK